MPRPSLALAALLFASASCLLGEEIPSHLLYMLPPPGLEHLSQPETQSELAARPSPPRIVEPVEAPRPAPRVEVVMTPVGETILSCSIPVPSDSPFTTPVAEPQSELVTLAFEPVVAPRPAL